MLSKIIIIELQFLKSFNYEQTKELVSKSYPQAIHLQIIYTYIYIICKWIVN